jgi:hypothetical protein
MSYDMGCWKEHKTDGKNNQKYRKSIESTYFRSAFEDGEISFINKVFVFFQESMMMVEAQRCLYVHHELCRNFI